MQKAIKFNKDISKLYLGNCLNVLPKIETDSIDTIVTDPPYGLKFMNTKWDASIPSVEIWKECIRVLKPGAFAFVMSAPRQDVLSRMICRLEDAGFDIGFSSIYWTYGTGFPKAQNLSRQIDKYSELGRPIATPATDAAKALDGAYSGMQLKPAVEIVIVAMKPLSEKTYLDQALKNGHGATWLDNCRIPFEREDWNAAKKKNDSYQSANVKGGFRKDGGLKGTITQRGRFPANVLCEDDVLNDGNIRKSGGRTFKDTPRGKSFFSAGGVHYTETPPNEGPFSRYFSLDAWFEKYIHDLPQEVQNTFPFLITPKPSKSEKLKHIGITPIDNSDRYNGKFPDSKGDKENKNTHPTIKPLKLMMWLITLASRKGDIILDPFMGSGTTPIAAKATHRIYKGIELEKEFYDIAIKRIDEMQQTLDSFL